MLETLEQVQVWAPRHRIVRPERFSRGTSLQSRSAGADG
jgi:hypothetical protein